MRETSNITFKYSLDGSRFGRPEKEIKMTLNGDMAIPELLEEFACFCRAVGYVIPGGFVQDEEIDFLYEAEPDSEEEEETDSITLSIEGEDNE